MKATTLGILGAILLGLLLCFAGSAGGPSIAEPPFALRHARYLAPSGLGSCGYCAAQDLLAFHGRQDLAARVRQHYAGPVWITPGNHSSLADVAKALGVACDYTASGDVAWLQRVSDEGRGAVIAWPASDDYGRPRYDCHAITFVGFDGEGYAWLIDNNSPWLFGRIGRAEFLATWSLAGGEAFTFNLPAAIEE